MNLPRRRHPLSREREQHALHEARHLVYGVSAGLPVMFAEIDLSGSGLSRAGQVVVDLDALTAQLVEKGRQPVVAYITSLLVGWMGTTSWLPCPAKTEWPPTWWDAWETEVESLRARISALDVTQEEYEEARLRADVFMLDATSQEAVAAVAADLLERQRVSREEAVELIAPILGAQTIAEATTAAEGVEP